MSLCARTLHLTPMLKSNVRHFAVRACTHSRFKEIWGREAYNPGLISSMDVFNDPHGTKEVAWYEGDTSFGCVVYSEQKGDDDDTSKAPEYTCVVFPKEEPFDFECQDPLVALGGFEDVTVAGNFMKERLAAFE